MANWTTIGEHLRRHRTLRRLSQDQIARLVDRTLEDIVRLEEGELADRALMIQVVDALGLSQAASRSLDSLYLDEV